MIFTQLYCMQYGVKLSVIVCDLAVGFTPPGRAPIVLFAGGQILFDL